MNCVGTGLLGGVDDLVDHQVALCSGVATESNGLVGQAHVQRVAIRLGVNGNGLEPCVTASTNDADGDFTTVGDENGAHGAPSFGTGFSSGTAVY